MLVKFPGQQGTGARVGPPVLPAAWRPHPAVLFSLSSQFSAVVTGKVGWTVRRGPEAKMALIVFWELAFIN